MRLVLLGGLSVLLAGTLAFGAWLVGKPREHRPEPVADEPDQPDTPAPARPARGQRQLPTVSAPPCTPRPGHACWRGQVRLSEAVRKVWADGREQERRATELARAEARARTQALDPEPQAPDDDDSADEVWEAGDDPAGEKALEQPLPPLGSWKAHATILAYPREQPVGDGGTPEDPREPVEAALEDDGTFELQVAPGTYDVELRTNDDRLVAYVDALTARAGAAEGGLDLVPVPTVAIAGRVVDRDGVGADALVQASLIGRDETAAGSTEDDGTFRFEGLRPGGYRVTATARGAIAQEAVEVKAPVTGVEVLIRWLPEGLLLVAPRSDGKCPRGSLNLTHSSSAELRPLRFVECQATAGFVRPGTAYRVSGTLGGRTYDTQVTFAGAPAAPICLDARCEADAAARIRVIDLAGNRVDWAAHVEDDEAGSVIGSCCSRAFRYGLRSGTMLKLRATTFETDGRPAVTGRATAWLAPGINQILIRLPQLIEPVH